MRKIVLSKDEPEVVATALQRVLHTDRSTEEVREEMVRLFLTIRDSLRQGPLLAQSTLPCLLAAFRKVAQRTGIDPEQLYSTLLERILLEGDSNESSRISTRKSTKDRILGAALEVFAEKGFHLATVDEIAVRADLGKGTLYRYFANKETLFSELVRLRLEELERSANAVLDGHDDVLTMIVKYLRIYFEFFDRNQRLYRLIVEQHLDVGEQVQDLYVKKVIRRVPLLKRKIYEASQQGVLKDIEFQTVFHGVMGFVHGVIQKWLASDCSYSLVDELPSVTEVLFYGFVKGGQKVADQ